MDKNASRKQAMRALIIVVAAVFGGELAIMFGLQQLGLKAGAWTNFADSLSLALIVFPIVCLAVFRPMLQKNRSLEIAEKALLSGQAELEKRIAERTAEVNRKQAQLREMIELLPAAIALMDKDDRFILWNQQYAETFPEVAPLLVPGISFEQALRASIAGGNYPKEVPPDGIEDWVQTFLASQRAITGVRGLRFHNGRWLRYSQRKTSEGATITIQADITEMKLREEFFRLLFDHNPIPMVIFDPGNLSFLAVNDEAVKHYGYSREQFLAMTLLDIRPPEDRQELIDHISAVRADPSEHNGKRDWRHLKADGTQIVVCIYAHNLVYEQKQATVMAIIDVTERRAQENYTRHLANHDSLTGLPNRQSFRTLLDNTLRRPSPAKPGSAVVLVDIDNFKDINDTLGHPVGDLLITAVAERLARNMREHDSVSRLGGDEFAIVLDQITKPEDVEQVLNRLLDDFLEPFDIEGNHISVDFSAGITLVPRDGNESDAILRNADLALYQAKADGRGIYRFFEPQMQLHVTRRRALKDDMRRAFKAEAFELHYQPLVDLKSSKTIGFEALLRWNHPDRGMISPAEFIPLAEETGLIIPLGAWVLERACREAATWREDLTLAVNLSPTQFKSGNIASSLVSALDVSGLAPDRLELEITETVLLGRSGENLRVLNQLKQAGASIVMDDFGTGFSSLSYLSSFPFDKIKIDRSFVSDLRAESKNIEICRAVLALGKSLNMRVLAEGIESKEQVDILCALGCTDGQGYYYGRATPAEEIAANLKAYRLSRRA